MLKALLSFEDNEAAMGPVAMDVMLAAPCILENHNKQAALATITASTCSGAFGAPSWGGLAQVYRRSPGGGAATSYGS